MGSLVNLDGYQFEDFRLDMKAHRLLRGGQFIPLTPKEFRTLLVLVEAAGEAVTKERLIREVWLDTFVSDSSLTRNISVLRKQLGGGSIETLPKFGYRFAYPVAVLQAAFLAPLSFDSRLLSVDSISLFPDKLDNAHAPPALISVEEPRPPPAMHAAQERQYHGRRFSILALTLAGVLLASSLYREQHRPPAANPARIAVLPFRNLSSEANADYLTDGLAEELITTLGQLDTDRIRILASSSTRLYSQTGKPAAQISRELHARYLVDGTAQSLDRQIVLTVHLVDGNDQAILWSGKFTRPLSQLPQVQAEIAEAIAREIQMKLEPEKSAGPNVKDSSDPLAHEAFLHGRFELEQKNVPAFKRALERFNAAVELDPHYARAYAGIAETYINLAGNIPTAPAYAHAKAAALNAIRLDDQLAEAHRDLGWLLFSDEADVRGAENEYRRALQLNPSDAQTHHWYAQLLIAERRKDAALQEAKTGLELDPLSLGSNSNYGFILIHAGKPEEAKRHLEGMLRREPQSEVVYGYLGRAFAALHQYDRAAECFKRAMELSDLKYQYKANWVYALAKAGDVAQAQALVDELEATSASGAWVPASHMTEAYIGLGNTDRAFVWLQRCVAEHSCTLLEVNNEPFYSELSSDPRFAAITAPLQGHSKTTLQAAIIAK